MADRLLAARTAQEIGRIVANGVALGVEIGIRIAADVVDNIMSLREFADDPSWRNLAGVLPIVPGVTKKADELAGVAATSGRPGIRATLPDRVTGELPLGQMRTPDEVKQARNFFERNREAARRWWSERNGTPWPSNAVHDSHPRPIKDGGDPNGT